MSETEKESRIKRPNHLIYRKGFWMVYTAFSYASIIFGGLSTILSALDMFEGSSASAPLHLLTSILFFMAGTVFLEARIFWGRLLLYTRKQDRQNELVINAKDVDDYRQKEAERNKEQLQQMDKAIEAAVERKMGDFDDRMELFTRQNAKMQRSSMNQYVEYLETRLKQVDASLDRIAGMVTAKAREKVERDDFRTRITSIFRPAPAQDEDDDLVFETAPIAMGTESSSIRHDADRTQTQTPAPSPAPAADPAGDAGLSASAHAPELSDEPLDEDEYAESMLPDDDFPADLLAGV